MLSPAGYQCIASLISRGYTVLVEHPGYHLQLVHEIKQVIIGLFFLRGSYWLIGQNVSCSVSCTLHGWKKMQARKGGAANFECDQGRPHDKMARERPRLYRAGTHGRGRIHLALPAFTAASVRHDGLQCMHAPALVGLGPLVCLCVSAWIVGGTGDTRFPCKFHVPCWHLCSQVTSMDCLSITSTSRCHDGIGMNACPIRPCSSTEIISSG